MRGSKPLVFVVMSFDNKYYSIFNMIEAIALQNGFDVARADEEKAVIKKIRPGIMSKLRGADLVIGEISSGSPNVLYEIGWAHAMGKPTLLLAEENSAIPFDINDYLITRYDPSMAGRPLRSYLEREICKHLDIAGQTINLRQPLMEVLQSLDDISSRDDLFTHLLGFTIERFARDSKQWAGNIIHVGAEEAIEKGTRIFQILKSHGFATYLVPLNPYWTTDTWNTDNEYFNECRMAARVRHVDIERVFLLPTYQALFNKSLQDHVTLDANARIRTHIAFTDNIRDKEAVRDFGIWDDELVCITEVGTVGTESILKGSVFTHQSDALSKAKAWRASIMSVATVAQDLLRDVSSLDEETKTLLQSAENMRRNAHTSCQGSYLTVNGTSCEWYHGAWQYLRILGLVSTPDWHSDFYSRALRDSFEAGKRAVLISGTADYAMLAHVAKAIPNELLPSVVISVLDACDTPLQVCKWFERWHEQQRKVQLSAKYIQGDALHTELRDETVDIIVTDAFLTRFNQEEREQLVREWNRLLKPGGMVITTARLSSKSQSTRVLPTVGEIADFELKATRCIDDAKPWLRPMKSTIAKLALGYAHNIVSYPVASKDYLVGLFHGFACDVHVASTPGEFAGVTDYAQIVATKT